MAAAIPGRGSSSRQGSRFNTRTHTLAREFQDPAPGTDVRVEIAKSVLTQNRSPDVPFSVSLNPYRGCEHGCVYCFARPTHSYLDLGPGLDFETKISAKTNAPALLEAAMRKPGYVPRPIALGVNTDAYQPAEKQLQLTRQCLDIALRYRQPVSLITKSSLILRDMDLLHDLAQHNLVSVAVSLTTLDDRLKAKLEPRAASAARRLAIIRACRDADVPVSALLAPVIPWINDHELEALLSAASSAGAVDANWVMLRLPHEVGPLFLEWLQQHFPDRAGKVESTLRQMHDGALYQSGFGRRMRGDGDYATVIQQRFDRARRQLRMNQREHPSLNTDAFCVPPAAGEQMNLL